jgi:hypothetical protein
MFLLVKRVPALHFLCLFREKPFVAYVICNTDRWTPLSHNSTCALIPRWRDSRCECQFCPTFWLSEPFFLAGWFWSALNWNRSRCRYRKGLAFHRRSRPRQMISRPRLGLNAISPSSLKRRSLFQIDGCRANAMTRGLPYPLQRGIVVAQGKVNAVVDGLGVGRQFF